MAVFEMERRVPEAAGLGARVFSALRIPLQIHTCETGCGVFSWNTRGSAKTCSLVDPRFTPRHNWASFPVATLLTTMNRITLTLALAATFGVGAASAQNAST